jgi:hypothetical protein
MCVCVCNVPLCMSVCVFVCLYMHAYIHTYTYTCREFGMDEPEGEDDEQGTYIHMYMDTYKHTYIHMMYVQGIRHGRRERRA